MKTIIIILAVIIILVIGCWLAYKEGEIHELHRIRAEFDKRIPKKAWKKLEEEL